MENEINHLTQKLREEINEMNSFEDAARKLGVYAQIKREVNKPSQQGPELDHGQTLCVRLRDGRVHGGGGNENRFAYGSDKLQDLVDNHNEQKRANKNYNRVRSGYSEDDERNKNERLESVDRRRRLSDLKTKMKEEERFDIFGNLKPKLVQPVNQPMDTEHQQDFFSNLNKNTERNFERTSTDLLSDKYLSNNSLWRNGRSSGRKPVHTDISFTT
uniref:Uncharacterized protein n=1 Tax=Aplanochytrium stocchinoi TaxID=215587 RepID=A0A7S3LJQ6_9STRA